MNIEVYTVEELPDLLTLDPFKDSEHLPIHPLRATSYYHNPSAEKSDKVLWCLFDGKEMLAYRLVLPDILDTPTEKIKACWLSCIWVNPNHRGKGHGKKLTNLALEEWNHKCLATNFAPASFKMYSSMKLFYPLKIINGLRLYYRMNTAELLANRNRIFAAAKPVLQIGDALFNSIKSNPKLHDLEEFDLTSQISLTLDDESFAFIKLISGKEVGIRSKEVFDWILAYPWIKQTPTVDSFARRYHFSANAKRFEQHWHKLSSKGEIIAVLMTSIIDDNLKIPYLYVQKDKVSFASKYIENFCLQNKIHSTTIFHPEVVAYFEKHKSRAIFKRVFHKKIMAFNGISKELRNEETRFQDGIGDGVFT